MRSDPMAVVDEKLRVHGIERPRVIDASVMPAIVSGSQRAGDHDYRERRRDDAGGRWVKEGTAARRPKLTSQTLRRALPALLPTSTARALRER
jgi:hypothetical protein